MESCFLLLQKGGTTSYYLVVGYMYYLLSENKIIISFGRKVYQLLLGNSTIIPNIFLQVKLYVNVKFQNWHIFRLSLNTDLKDSCICFRK